jgi:uncharacterized protein (DUF2147 family)
MLRIVFFLLTITCFTGASWVANDISGTWINQERDAHIKIYSSYGKFYGQVVWMKNPIDSTTKKPQLDKFNKDPKLRCRPVMNLIIISNLVFDKDKQEWNGGEVYNPKTGDSYDLYCTMKDKSTLEMHFYMTIPAVGKTFNWTRIK